MKPCYLVGRPGMWVGLDGPALSISRPERARQLLPLSRVSRIVASGPLELSTEALLACAERGITVTFLDGQGEVRAYLFGESTRRDGLYQRLRDFLDRPDWPERYDDWRRSVDSRALRALCRRLRLPPERHTLHTLELRFHQLQSSRIGARQRGFVAGRLHGLTRALAAELLSEAGLGAAQLRALDERLDPTADLTRWLVLDLQLPLLNWLATQPEGAPITDRALVAFFESRAFRLDRLGHGILNRLHGFLVEL
jgi:hypothetical protein